MRCPQFIKSFCKELVDICTKPLFLEEPALEYLREQALRVESESWPEIASDIHSHISLIYYAPALKVFVGHPTVNPIQGKPYLDTSRVLLSIEASNISVMHSHYLL